MKKIILTVLIVFLFVLSVPLESQAYVLWQFWLGGSDKVLRYNQIATKHSLQVAHADIHWNNQVPGTIQRRDSNANFAIFDYYEPNSGVGGQTVVKGRTIALNDFYMIRSNHALGEVSFMISTHEFGHALGLWHSPSMRDVMYSSFGKTIINNLPTADEKAGLIASKKRW